MRPLQLTAISRIKAIVRGLQGYALGIETRFEWAEEPISMCFGPT